MAETDILNPQDWLDAGLVFNPNPSYGFSRKLSANRQTQRPRLGPFIDRQTGNGGHIFPLTWINTDLTTAERVVKFYHDFRSGYFTYIDVDRRCRHFVGRFTSEPEVVETANGKFTVQNTVFEEIPQARMLEYPADWDRDGHPINVVDDALKPRVATYGVGAWVAQLSPLAGSSASPNDPTAYEMFDPNSGGLIVDWAQAQYVGWGFRMTFRLDPTLGQVNVSLDGNIVVAGLDLSTGLFASTSPLLTLTSNQPTAPGLPSSITVEMTSVSLDQHRVKVQGVGFAANGTGIAFIYPALEYIY